MKSARIEQITPSWSPRTLVDWVRRGRRVPVTPQPEDAPAHGIGSRDRKSVLISNVFDDSNKGGAAITTATVRMVTELFPDDDVKLIAIHNRTNSYPSTHRFTLKAFPQAQIIPPLVQVRRGPLAGIRCILKSLFVLFVRPTHDPAVQAVGSARAVISKGGYVFVERTGLGSLAALWLTAFPLVLASVLGVRTAIVCTSVGPFRTLPSRLLNQWILRRVDLVVARDSYSFDAALDLGLDPSKVREFPDIVFSYEKPTADDSARVVAALGLTKKRYGAMTLSHSGGMDRAFQQNLRHTVLAALERGIIDELAVVQQGGRLDVKLSQDFVALVDDDRVRYIDVEHLGPDELMAFYGAARFLIARRMHSAVFSLLAGTPVFVFAMRGAKVQGVMESIKLGDYVIYYPLERREELVEKIATLSANMAVEEERVRRAVSEARTKLEYLPCVMREVLFGLEADPAWNVAPAELLSTDRTGTSGRDRRWQPPS